MNNHTRIAENSVNVILLRGESLVHHRLLCISQDEVERIHDLRVSTRRLRAALNLFGPLSTGNKAERLHLSVRSLTRELGKLRNIDEAILFFSDALNRVGQADVQSNPVMARLIKQRGHESKRVGSLLEALDTDRFSRRIAILGAGLAGIVAGGRQTKPEFSLPAYLSACGIRLFHDIYTLLPFSQNPENVKKRHDLRIAIKQWRYFLEIMAEISERDYSVVLARLKEYQTILGELNDLSVFSEMLEQYGENASGYADLMTLMNGREEKLLNRFNALVVNQPLSYTFLM